jgi:hypothetical protein
MRLLFAIILVLVTSVLLVRPAMARTPSCFTYVQPALRRLQTLCNEGCGRSAHGTQPCGAGRAPLPRRPRARPAAGA